MAVSTRGAAGRCASLKSEIGLASRITHLQLPTMRGDSDGSRGAKRATRHLTLASRLLLDHRMPNRGEVIRMDTQITHKSGLANNLWVQMAALVIVTIVVIALAAEFIW
jgi:hypothetical protein